MPKIKERKDETSRIDAKVKETPRASTGKTTAFDPSKTQSIEMEEVVRGRVVGYTVDSKRLVVKLDCGAIRRIAFSVDADEPHFRAAVSMTMIALNNRVNPATQEGSAFDHQYLWAKLAKLPTPRLPTRDVAGDIRTALAVGLSNSTDADPFDIANFVYEG
ncbi:MAG TPA: hypothetical protein PLP42_04155 [Acidobacteriota bacterium]|nr:hypothetical protein [Acidobacteriota bacterium]